MEDHDRCQRQLDTLERLLQIPAGDLETALSTATDLVAFQMKADKVDAFLYRPESDTLKAVGTSHQPLSAKQRQYGLDVLPVSNGGRVVHVFRTNESFVTGRLRDDPEEVRGVRETLQIESKLGVPLRVGGLVRGVLMIASLERDRWTEEDKVHAESIGRWVSLVLQRAELVQEIAKNAGDQGRKAGAEEIVTILAHDIRNHLAPLQTRLALVRRIATRDQRAGDVAHMDQALRSLDRLTELVEDILDVSRLDRGMFDLVSSRLDFVDLIEETASTLSTPDQPILVKVRVDGELFVNADGSRLRQVLENLFANGLKHSPRNTPLNVQVSRKASESGDVAVVDVVDEGPGVPEDVLPRIFERFVSGQASSGGLGLGLYLARKIARMHGGELTVENLPAKGARFTLSLPTCPPPATAERDEDTPKRTH